MSRRTIYILIIALIIIGLGAWWFLSRENSAPATSQPTSTGQNLFPYGQNATSTSGNTSTNGNQGTVFLNNNGSSTTPPALIHITTTPVSGYVFLPESASSSSATIRYVDRATGRVYDYSFDTNVTTEVTNTTVPQVYQAYFSNTGTRVFLQTLDVSGDIETMSAAVNATTTGPVALGDVRFLPKNIISLSPNDLSLFYLISTTNGSMGYISAIDGTKPSEVFGSALGELISRWQSTNVTLQTKASASADGYFFGLNAKTGGLTTIVHNVAGLTALENNSGTFVFGSASENGTLESFIYNEKENSMKTISSLGTLADKCVWSAENPDTVFCAVPTTVAGTLPDDWYQGNIFLPSDNVWTINADTGVANVVDFLSERNQNIDVENPVLSGNEKWFSFMDKEDLTLWALRIAQ